MAGMSYAKAGVDIDKADEAVRRIKGLVKSTRTKHVLSDVGSFGGMIAFPKGYKEPVLVASTDGVGTKLKLAYMEGRHHSIGQDLVNHCVNDILVQGAKPLFFLDYIGTGKLEPRVVEGIVKGLAKACKENGCALIGGEIAEMPGIYRKGEYDLASCIVGVVERKGIVTGKGIRPGDVVIGLRSSGLHTNGYSLALKVLSNRLKDRKLRSLLMAVHKSYLKPISDLMKSVKVKGMAHITGGGLPGNIPRILPKGISVEIEKRSWRVPPIFTLIQDSGKISEKEMFRTFNMGVGMVVIVAKKDAKKALRLLKGSWIAGHVVKGRHEVKLV